MPSSLEISSLEKVNPGIRPRFLSQKIEQKAPEKKIPSTAAKAIKRSAKLGDSIHLRAQSAFSLIAGKFSKALKSLFFSFSHVGLFTQLLIGFVISKIVWLFLARRSVEATTDKVCNF